MSSRSPHFHFHHSHRQAFRAHHRRHLRKTAAPFGVVVVGRYDDDADGTDGGPSGTLRWSTLMVNGWAEAKWSMMIRVRSDGDEVDLGGDCRASRSLMESEVSG